MLTIFFSCVSVTSPCVCLVNYQYVVIPLRNIPQISLWEKKALKTQAFMNIYRIYIIQNPFKFHIKASE